MWSFMKISSAEEEIKMKKTTFITAGDAFITKRLPEGGYEGFAELQACIQSHDVKFLNLELLKLGI